MHAITLTVFLTDQLAQRLAEQLDGNPEAVCDLASTHPEAIAFITTPATPASPDQSHQAYLAAEYFDARSQSPTAE